VSTSSLSPDEIRAAAEVHGELGPNYRDAVVDSFLDKVGKEIEARVDARLAQGQVAPVKQPRGPRDTTFPLAIASIALGIPITAIVLSVGQHQTGIWGLLVVWIAIATINVAHSVHTRARDEPGHRPR
jgi:hypothetical protein